MLPVIKLGKYLSNNIRKNNVSYDLLKHIRPIWYFHLTPKNNTNQVWADYDLLSKNEKNIIQFDCDYSSNSICKWDSAFQALSRGIIVPDKIGIQEIVKVLPIDIYRFIRKYYKNMWVYWTCFMRIILGFNLLKEINGVWKTRYVKKQGLFNPHLITDDYIQFNSKLINENLLISIIIPTYNRYESLQNVLQNLEKQDYKNFEIIIIDQSESYSREFYNNYKLIIKVIHQTEPALWEARNTGVKLAKSNYLLFLDDDSIIQPNWISSHLKCIDYYDAQLSSGISLSISGAKVPENYYFFRWGDQLDTGNVLIKREVFNECGLFDKQFEKMRMGDGEFGLRAYLNGFKNISNPEAFREHLKISKGGLRDLGSWDAFRPTKLFSPRPVPSVFYFWRKYWGNKSALLSCIITIPFSLSPYKYKDSIRGLFWSIIIFFMVFPIILIQVILSWNISSKMLKQGAIIEKLSP